MLRLPDEVNISPYPYKKVAFKSLIAFGILILVGYLLSVSSVYFVSLDKERRWFAGSYGEILTADQDDSLTQYIRTMVTSIDPSMVDYVHVQCDDGAFDNAMATLGGQVFIGKTLIEGAQSENELFFVLAHEIGHVKERHVVRQIAFKVPFMLAQIFLGQSVPINSSGDIVGLDFSRRFERQSDQYAIAALMDYYGHVGGVKRFFEGTDRPLDGWQDYLGSHPSHGKRLESLSTFPEGATTLFRKKILETSCLEDEAKNL
jgi:predicted Zn-dependent protease